jgi:hypothetical protein
MHGCIPPVLLTYLSYFQSGFSKPSFVYFQGYIWSLLLTQGRKCMTRIAYTCFFVDRHLSSWERFLAESSWDLTVLSKTLVAVLISKLGAQLMVYGAYLAALDTTLVAKVKGKMLGVQKWHQSSANADRGDGIVGHHWGLIGLISFSVPLSRYVCWPILMRLIPGQHNPFLWIVDAQGVITQGGFWEAVLPLAYHLFELLGHAPLRIVADAYFAKAPFIQPLLERGIHVVTRMRKDAVGWDDPVYCGRGRRPKHGKQWSLASLLTHFQPQKIEVFLYGEVVALSAVVRDVWIRDVAQKVRVVVVEGIKEPLIFLSTDLSLSAVQIIEIYGARFSIESALRVLKTDLGLGDYQCTTFGAMVRFVHLACTALCLFRLLLLKEETSSMDNQGTPGFSKESPLSLSTLRRRFQRFAVQRILFSKSAQDADFENDDAVLEKLLRIAA